MDVVILITGIVKSIKSYINVENMSQIGNFDSFVKKVIAYPNRNNPLLENNELLEREMTILNAHVEFGY